MTSPPGPYVGPTDWDSSIEMTSGRFDNVEFGLSKTMLYAEHNGTAWPARNTVTTSTRVKVGWIGPAPIPSDFLVGVDVLFDTSAAAVPTTATYRAVSTPLNTLVSQLPYINWDSTVGSWSIPAAAASGVVNDMTYSLGGESSLALTTKGDSVFMTASNATFNTFSVTANPNHALSIWLRADDPTALQSCSVFVGSSQGNSYYQDMLNNVPTKAKPVLFPNAWRKVTFLPLGSNVQGTPVATSVIRFALSIQDRGVATTIRVSNHMQWEPIASTKFPTGVVSMDFDDSGASVKKAIPILNSHGWRGSLVPITSFIGGTNMLTWSEVKDIHTALGWPVKSHCRYDTSPISEHVGFDTLTADQMIDTISGNRDILISQGLGGSEHWAAPNGSYGLGVETQRMVLDILAPYIDTARITQSLRPIGTLPPGNRLMLENKSDVGGPSNGISTYTTATTGILDKVLASKGWTHMTFHTLIDSGTPTNNQITVADFTTLCTAIAAKGIAVLPTAEVIQALR